MSGDTTPSFSREKGRGGRDIGHHNNISEYVDSFNGTIHSVKHMEAACAETNRESNESCANYILQFTDQNACPSYANLKLQRCKEDITMIKDARSSLKMMVTQVYANHSWRFTYGTVV